MVLVSVIIPARNAADTLGACLDALAFQGVPGKDAELLVVDDGSADGTRCLARRLGARVLDGMDRGPAAARNRGARLARGRVLLFLDADTAPCPGWLDEMLAPFQDPEVVGVKGRYYSTQRSLAARFAQLEFEEKYARLERARQIDFLDTGTAAYRRDVLLAAGGFDEQFPAQSAEDVELAFRLAAQGARLVFNPRAGVLHRHAESLRSYLAKKVRYGFFRVRVYRRFPRKALGDSYTPPVMALQIALAGCSLVLLAGTLRWHRAGGFSLLATLGIFGFTTRSLVRRAWPEQADLALLTPALVFARATAQGTGIFAGLLSLALGRAARE